MFYVYVALMLISALFLIILCLLQASKKESASGSTLGSSTFSQVIDVKSASDILEKLTLFFTFAIFCLSILSYFSLTSDSKRRIKSLKNNETVNNSVDDTKDTKDAKDTKDKK